MTVRILSRQSSTALRRTSSGMCNELDGTTGSTRSVGACWRTDNREVIKRWKQHFDEHLNGAQAGDQDGGERYIAGVANDEVELLPTMSEVKEAISQLNSNKSAGKDGIVSELMKMGPDKLDKQTDLWEVIGSALWKDGLRRTRSSHYGKSTKNAVNTKSLRTIYSSTSKPHTTRLNVTSYGKWLMENGYGFSGN